MYTTERPGVIRSAIVAATPRPGQKVELPRGLLYTNEFFAVRQVLTEPTTVCVTARDRDEFYWRNSEGRSCYAYFSLRSSG
jgi:hypothetical protein